MKTEYFLYAGSALLFLYYWLRLRPGRAYKTPILLIVHDGSSFVVHRARRDDAGNIVAGGITYPAGVPVRCENEADLSNPVYMLAADPLALAHHRTLEVARRHIVMGSLFRSGGDMVEMLRLVGAALVIACALYGLLQIRTLNTTYATFGSELRSVNEKLSNPLVAVPAEEKK